MTKQMQEALLAERSLMREMLLEIYEEYEQYKAIGTVEEIEKKLEELELYKIAFDLLLKDDCKFAPQGWTGSIDDLYIGRKAFYFNKAKVIRD